MTPQSIAANQQRVFLRLLGAIRPRWRSDPALPAFIQSLLARERRFGSRDRRLYRELIYTTLRYLPWIEPFIDSDPDEAVRRVAWLSAELPATKSFRLAFATGEPPTGDRSELIPAWFRAHCPELFSPGEAETMLRRAPLWLRLQTDPASVSAVRNEFAMRGWRCRPSAVLSSALQVLDDADITTAAAWREGKIEVQDLGSQLILAAVGVESGGHWLDACAGAGGKTLQLAQRLGPEGAIDAHDVRAEALEELRSRAKRAGVPLGPDATPANAATVQILPSAPRAEYDGVLVDAPCSGSGTWRRAPHLKWVATESQLFAAAKLQRDLLQRFSERVKPGGRLVYATCSLSSRENEDVVAAFLASNRHFAPAPFAQTFGALPRGDGLLILPSLHDTDGFFVASLRRR